MLGCRPLTPAELAAVSAAASGRFEHRNRLLIWTCITTGFRISEALALNIGDIWRNGRPVERIRLARRHTKGKKKGASAFVTPILRPLIRAWIEEYTQKWGLSPDAPLFRGRTMAHKAISRMQAHRIMAQIFERAGIYGGAGELATHTLRKTYAARVYARFGDVFAVQQALRHSSPASTVAYLSFDTSRLDAALEAEFTEIGARTACPSDEPENVVQFERKHA